MTERSVLGVTLSWCVFFVLGRPWWKLEVVSNTVCAGVTVCSTLAGLPRLISAV